MNPLPIIVVVALLSTQLPFVGDLVFKWIPASVSVVTGYETPSGVWLPPYMPPEAPPQHAVSVALQPLPNDSRYAMVAQAATAYDSMIYGPGAEQQAPLTQVADSASNWLTSIVPLSIFFSLMLITGIIYSIIRIRQIREQEHAAWSIVEHPIVGGDNTKAQLRWQKIVEHANTDNPNDWRQSIIEADIMLDELLTVQGYHGATLGDKMKQVERSDFNTIDLAWEAHKVRNRIAHQGSDHDLNAREVRRVISLYEQTLREFHYI